MTNQLSFFRLLAFILLLYSASVAGRDCSKLIVSGHPGFPPFSWSEGKGEKRLTGMMVNLVQQAAIKENITVDIRYIGPWKRVLAEAGSGRIDMIAGSFKVESRLPYLHYGSQAIANSHLVVFYAKENIFPFAVLSDLTTLKGGTQIGGSMGKMFDQYRKKGLTIYEASNITQVFRMLAAGRIDYVVSPLYIGIAHIAQSRLSQALSYHTRAFGIESTFAPLSKSSPCLKKASQLLRALEHIVQHTDTEKMKVYFFQRWAASKGITLPEMKSVRYQPADISEHQLKAD